MWNYSSYRVHQRTWCLGNVSSHKPRFPPINSTKHLKFLTSLHLYPHLHKTCSFLYLCLCVSPSLSLESSTSINTHSSFEFLKFHSCFEMFSNSIPYIPLRAHCLLPSHYRHSFGQNGTFHCSVMWWWVWTFFFSRPFLTDFQNYLDKHCQACSSLKYLTCTQMFSHHAFSSVVSPTLLIGTQILRIGEIYLGFLHSLNSHILTDWTLY